MARTSIKDNAEAIFIGPSPATGNQTGIQQLFRATTYSTAINFQYTDIRQLGQSAAVDRIITNPPTVSFETSWTVSNLANEEKIGLYVDGDKTAIVNILDGSQNDKNLFVKLAPQGVDANYYVGTDGGVYSVGNAFLNSWSTQGGVGQIPTASASFEGLNATQVLVTTGFQTPAIDTTLGTQLTGLVSLPAASTGVAGQLAALRPTEIDFDISGIGLFYSTLCAQSYNISVQFNREPLSCLGSKYPYAYDTTFPIVVSASIEANARDPKVESLIDQICVEKQYDITLKLRAPACSGAIGDVIAQYIIKGAKLDSQSSQNSVGNKRTVTLNLSSQIGGSGDISHGLFLSGVGA